MSETSRDDLLRILEALPLDLETRERIVVAIKEASDDSFSETISEMRAEAVAKREAALSWANGFSERLLKTFDDFGLTRPDGDERLGVWRDLVIRLLIEREPKLHPFPNRGGAPIRSETVVKDFLILLALGPGRAPGKSIPAAAAHLAKRPHFKGMSAGYIKNRFYLLLRSKTPEGTRVRKHLEHMQKNPSP